MKIIHEDTDETIVVMGCFFSDLSEHVFRGNLSVMAVLVSFPGDSLNICYCNDSYTFIDSNIPNNWFINKDKSDFSEYIAGYYELCFDSSHISKLLDGNKKALEIYYQRKYETYELPETPVHQLFEQYEEVKIKGMDNSKRYFIEEFVDDDNCLVTSYNGETKEITIYTDKYKLSKIPK